MSDNSPGNISAWVFSMSTSFFNEFTTKVFIKIYFLKIFITTSIGWCKIYLLQIYSVKNHLMENISKTIWNWITKHKKQVRSYKHIRTNSHVFTINFEQVIIPTIRETLVIGSNRLLGDYIVHASWIIKLKCWLKESSFPESLSLERNSLAKH